MHTISVLEMKDALDITLAKDAVDVNDVSFGFHWPPFNSITHLHLHGVAPVSKMRFLARWIFRPNNIWYCTVCVEIIFEIRIDIFYQCTIFYPISWTM